MGNRVVRTAAAPLRAALDAPPSKSVTHRALLAGALASGTSAIVDPLDSDDTRVTREGLRALGVGVQVEPGCWTVEGRGPGLRGGANLCLANSGASLRFLCALAAMGSAVSRLDGAARLRQRPIEELVAAIRRLGGHAEPLGAGPGLPLAVGGRPLRGASVELDGSRSSQFASALLMIGPRLPGGLRLALGGNAASVPYVELTARVLGQFGLSVERRAGTSWSVASSDYPGRAYRVEGDHSTASYWLAAAAAVGGEVRVGNLKPDSPQPDSRFPAILEALGCAVERGESWIRVRGTGRVASFDLDLRGTPDLVPTLGVLALFSEGVCHLRGIGHLRYKESDRLQVLAEGLGALGARVRPCGEGLTVAPGPLRGARLRTAGDHRMAMAFAIAGLRIEGVSIEDPECVSKSHPAFWEQLAVLERRV